MAGGAGQLLERTHELSVIDDALHAACERVGALTLIEGPPGIGKTELLGAAIAHARSSDMRVMSARGGELELSFPYAIVRQLFEPTLTHADVALRDRVLSGAAGHATSVVDPHAQLDQPAVETGAVLHGLYWLTANLAADQPVLLVIDDLHWSDQVSASWILYLARRLEGLPIALLLGARPSEPGGRDVALERLRAIPGIKHIWPAPLSLGAVNALARTVLGDQVEASFSQACHAVTGGNPFYVTELLRALRNDRVAGTAGDVRAIEGLSPTAVIGATLARVGRLPPEARDVAETIALLEPRAELRWIAALTELPPDAVATTADALLDLGLLRTVAPCRYEHPILRSAIETEIPPARRGRLHLKAARMLSAAQMPAEVIASHLMQTPPAGEPWIAGMLREAARRASSRGASAAAVAYLERALQERPKTTERRELLLDLGKAESQIQSVHAPEHLREALELAERPDEIAVIALWLGQALYHAGALDEAYQTLSELIDRCDGQGGDALLELEAYLLSIATAAGKMRDTAPRAAALEARTPTDSPAAAAVQATLAFRETFSGESRRRIHERAKRALVDIQRGSSAGAHLADRQAPGTTLVWIDELDVGIELFTELLTTAARTGRMQTFEIFSALRGYALQRRGDLADAAADVEPILETKSRAQRADFAELIALITHVQLLVDDGQPDAAEARASAARLPTGYERGFMAAQILYEHGATQLAQAKFEQSAATLTAVGKLCDINGIRTPALFPWRSDLALALAGTHRHDEALALANTELRLADACELDRARGHALRAIGLLTGGDAGLQHLQAAVQAFSRAPAPLEHGWAYYELGAALRRANRRRDARAPLDQALDLGLRCGASWLTQRAREELRALGARPRSVMLTGVESLTPSERRICRLAGDGMRNTDIAQALFVSIRTVETHLGHAYRKLDITSRNELSAALHATTG